MLHRIRYAFGMAEPVTLTDEVEVDETYIGGKAKNMHRSKRQKKITGRGASGKTPILGLVERNGRVYARPVQDTSAATLQSIVRERVEQGSLIFTDEAPAYNGLENDYGHDTINHSAGNSLMVASTRTRLKALEPTETRHFRHLPSGQREAPHRYCAEFDYRYNTRKSKEAPRFDSALTHTDGRLMYKVLTAKQ